MLKIRFYTTITLVFFSITLLAQNEDFGETRLFYRSEFYGGYFQHTNGWGGVIRKAKRIDGYKKWVFGAELVSMKHNKEVKQLTSNIGSLRRYTYGKINAFTIFRPSVGRQKIIFTKDVKKGVEISLNYAIGASVGFLKPVYLRIATPDVNSSYKQESTERYDPTKHFPNNIIGKSSYFKGIEQSKVYPGLYAKFGLGFEYSPYDDEIRYLETGVTLDGYYTEIPIMAFVNNQQLFVTYYISFMFGKKHI